MSETAVAEPDLFFDAAATAVAVEGCGLALAQVDLATQRVVSVSDAAVALLVCERPQIVGRVVSDFIDSEPTGALPLLATGRLDGFEAPRRLRRCDGEVVETYVWAHVLGLARPARFAAVFLQVDSAPVAIVGDVPEERLIGSVDEEWRIDRISREAEPILGYRASDLAGAPLLSAVNPSDLPELLAGLAHVHATGRNAMIRIRVRRSDRSWLWCRVRLASLDPPRFAFTLQPLVDSSITSAERVSDLERRLARIAYEIRGPGAVPPSARSPVLTNLPELAELTSREWETLRMLADGARVSTIAAELGLSASTVRNHLSSIFRKVDVGSQAELLARLKQTER